jgi:hypothetical protein
VNKILINILLLRSIANLTLQGTVYYIWPFKGV